MTPERWKQIEKLYHAALEREPAAEMDFLTRPAQGTKPCVGKSNRCWRSRNKRRALLKHLFWRWRLRGWRRIQTTQLLSRQASVESFDDWSNRLSLSHSGEAG